MPDPSLARLPVHRPAPEVLCPGGGRKREEGKEGGDRAGLLVSQSCDDSCEASTFSSLSLPTSPHHSSTPHTPRSSTASCSLPNTCSPAACRHSYYDCCVKVAASKLLEHWLDAPSALPCPPAFPEELLGVAEPLPAVRQFLTGSPDSPDNLVHVVLARHPPLPAVVPLVRLLVAASPSDTLATDDHGDSALTMVRHLLEAGQHQRAEEVATLLLRHGAHSTHTNMCGWSLLAYSLTHQDASIQLTRTLLSHGASVLPDTPGVAASSPFRVFLGSLVRAQALDGGVESLALLGQVMGRHPARMKAHVLAALRAEARYPNLRTMAIFREVRERLAPHWTGPTSLLHLSLHASRRRLGLKRLNSGQLPVAPRLANYLSYKLTLPANLPTYSQDSTTHKTEPAQYQEDLLSSKIRLRLAAS